VNGNVISEHQVAVVPDAVGKLVFIRVYLGSTVSTTQTIMTISGSNSLEMVEDSFIVTLENIYKFRERGAKATISAILGSQEMVSFIINV
jgi:hypothetical protein